MATSPRSRTQGMADLFNQFRNRLFWLVTFSSLIVDRLTKAWIENGLPLTTPPSTTPIIPGVFHITYVVNTGAAFSLFQGSGWLRWLSLLVSVGLMVFAWFGPKLRRLEQWGYCLLYTSDAADE